MKSADELIKMVLNDVAGGKGRTGTMICVWLVEAGLFSSASDSLDYFGARRTDTRVGRTFQGVETPSQVCDQSID